MPHDANARIAAGNSTCQLTYDLSTDPAPVTASVASSDPSFATLTFVVTNDSGGDLDLGSVVFSIPVGPDAASLSPGSAGIGGTSLDTRWQLNGPSTPVSQGLAAFTLAPRSGATLPVPNGSAVVVIFTVPVNQLTGTATIDIAEHIDATPGFTSFAVTKYPPGFFFDSLTVNVASGSDLQPVAQVAYDSAVTLTWNVSVVPLSAIAIYRSTNDGPAQPVSPSSPNRWASPALVNDTIFTIVVTAIAADGDPVTAALSATVAVERPDLLANRIDAQSLTVAGTATVGGAFTANARAALNAGATVAGGLTADTLTASAGSTLNGGATVTRGLTVDRLTVGGPTADTPCVAVGAYPGGYIGLFHPFPSSQLGMMLHLGMVLSNPEESPDGDTLVSGISVFIGRPSDIALSVNGIIRNSGGVPVLTHLPTRAGDRLHAAALTREIELHLNGEGRLERGLARILFDDDSRDTMCASHRYRVQVTPADPCNGLAVVERDAAGFTVRECGDGRGDARFDWFVVARQRESLESEAARDMPALPPHELPAPPG